jgi:F-type H+-transporting ATPase subunit delta
VPARKDALVDGYAQALFAVAEAEGALSTVEAELYAFAGALQREAALRDALTDPALPADRKQAVLRDILGDRASSSTVNLLTFLVEQGHARDLGRIVERLVALAAERRNAAVAEVRSAVPLDADQQKRLAGALEKATGRTIELRVLVDPSVIGGVVAKVGDQVIDGSVRSRFDEVKQLLQTKA